MKYKFDAKKIGGNARSLVMGAVLTASPLAAGAQDHTTAESNEDTTELQIPTEVYTDKIPDLYELLDYEVTSNQSSWEAPLKQIYLQGYNFGRINKDKTITIPDHINTEEELAYFLFGVLAGLDKGGNAKETKPTKVNQNQADRQRTASMRKAQNDRANKCGASMNYRKFKRASRGGSRGY